MRQVREKLLSYGNQALTDFELLSLASGITTEAGSELLRHFKALRRLAGADASALQECPGMGTARATQLLAAIELGRRVLSEERVSDEPVRHSSDVAKRLMPGMRDLRKERFVVLLLDRKNVIADIVTINLGTVDQANPHVREILQLAIRRDAPSVIVAHNHPSGSIRPSDQDKAFTRNLVTASKAIGITCFDHVIIGNDCYFSFADEGLIAAYAAAAVA